MAREVGTIQSRIEQVTVYAHGARVRRIATLRAPVPPVVRFADLPVAVMDDTVRTEAEGAGTVTSIRVGIDIPGGEARTEESAELRAARRRVAVAETEVERVRIALEQLESSTIIEDDPTDDAPAAWAAVLSARRALVALRATRERTLREQHAATRRELEDARRALEVAAEKDRDSGSAQAARLHEVRKYVELEVAATGDVTVRLEYQIAAARWAPSYVARLDGERASFELRAVVAQDSGEDWAGVALRLSTAEPEQFTQLPELQPQKIGRRQQEPARRGFRPPPVGAAALYADYERSFPRRALPIGGKGAVFDDSTYEGRVPTPSDRDDEDGVPIGGLRQEVWDEDSSIGHAKDAYKTPPPSPAMSVPMPMTRSAGKAGGIAGALAGAVAAPFALAAQAVSKKEAPASNMARYRGDFGGGGAPGSSTTPTTIEAATPVPRLDYGNLRMAPPSSSERGTLVAAPRGIDGGAGARVTTATAKIAALELPPGHDADWAHTYDYAFASDGMVDIASDGAWHSIALTSKSGSAKIHHVAVPREQADVFRVAAIANPFTGPLLPGPIDVYDRGQFLVTSEVDYTPPGGTVDVGLGVDPTVKIARNVEFREEAAGMLRGALRLIHAITIDVENLSPRPIEIEVRERVPVTREGEDEIEVTLGKVEPSWDRYTPDADAPDDERLRGGYRWKLDLPASSKKLLRAGYQVEIKAKLELIGGNRREP
ncbi:MAG TPA: mucoidy inhibitor MuiA family protein [Kofleriaceae bacterium]|nr:mucoidy inhibitor MuiA family protein [Kofleriaceae bacterium]